MWGCHDVGEYLISFGGGTDTREPHSFCVPLLGEETSLTVGYTKASAPTVPGDATYFRFWLDVPLSVSSVKSIFQPKLA